jgi:hypothetical protein
VLRNHESRHFGAYGRGRGETADEKSEQELEEEAGVFDLLAAFRNVVLQKPRLAVHEVEIDDVTIEDRMQEVEIALNERGRSLFEDLFANDSRTISLVVTFMAILELAKLDRIVFRQSRAMGPIWVYRKQKAADYELELRSDESHLEPLPEFRPGLVEIVQAQIKQRAVKNALEEALRDLENGILPGEGKPDAETAAASPADGNQVPEAETASPADGNQVPGAETAAPADGGESSGAEAEAQADGNRIPEAETAAQADKGEGSGAESQAPADGSQDLGVEAGIPGTRAPTEERAAGPDGTDGPDPIADAALRDLMRRMREASEGEAASDIPEDED